MRFTDVFVRRVVLSLVVSALILIAGLRAYVALPVQQFPQTVSATITISTAYYGADAATVADRECGLPGRRHRLHDVVEQHRAKRRHAVSPP